MNGSRRSPKGVKQQRADNEALGMEEFQLEACATRQVATTEVCYILVQQPCSSLQQEEEEYMTLIF
jgi:isopentenyldiphosphate isomerase